MIFPEELLMVLPVVTAGIPSTLLSLAGYVLTAYALYVIAKRRCIGRASGSVVWSICTSCTRQRRYYRIGE